MAGTCVLNDLNVSTQDARSLEDRVMPGGVQSG
jgi:hypothetical protein